jgi:sugar phosphate isomerase/epimerase
MRTWSRRRLLRGALGGTSLVAAHPLLDAPASAQPEQPREPPFGLGTVSYNVTKDWDLATTLRILPQVAMYAVEFRTTHAHGVEPALSPAQRADVKARCAAAGMKQLSLGTICEFHSSEAPVVRENIRLCREWVALAADLGALGVKVRPNGFVPGVEQERTLEQISRALRVCGDAARDNGVEIWVEVHGPGTQEPENMKQILERCDHPAVGICWNSNPTDVRNGSVRAAFDLLRPWLRNVHINTLWGRYPYRELFALLREAGYSRYTLCEVATPVHPESGLVFFQCYRGLWRELARA